MAIKKEMVDHPSHYSPNTIEVIDAIEAWGLLPEVAFHLGNTIKYVARAGKKGDAREDLLKAKWYLDRAIMVLEKKSLKS